MVKQVCKSCCATKDDEEFDGYRTCNMCREAKSKCYTKNQKECRAKGSRLCQECGHKIKHESCDAHFHYALHPNSELTVLMKDYLRKLSNSRKERKLNDKMQADIKAEHEKQTREIRKRLKRFQTNLLMSNHSPNPNNRNPILTRCLIMSCSSITNE